MKDATTVAKQVDERVDRWREYLRPVAEWFHDDEGDLRERNAVINTIAEEFELDVGTANTVVSALVADVVDPVVQARTDDGDYVGVMQYHEFEGCYGYLDVHDVVGTRKRVVCAQCVQTATADTDVRHATEGAGSFGPQHEWADLVAGVHDHYEDAHDVVPDAVETGATLASGSTIGGNTAWHAGNDGYGSGLDAATLVGYDHNDFVFVNGDTMTGNLDFDLNQAQNLVVDTYSSGDPTERTPGQLWYRSDLDQ